MSRKAHTKGSVPLGEQQIDCGTHGKVPWYGDVVCAKCGAVFVREGDVYPDAPESGLCTCGVQLFPKRNAFGVIEGIFSARVCCRDCAKTKSWRAHS